MVQTSHTLKVLFSKASILVRELKIHTYVNIHSVVVFPQVRRHTHPRAWQCFLKLRTDVGKRVSRMKVKNKEHRSSPVTGWVSGGWRCYSCVDGILNTPEERSFNVPMKGNRKETDTSFQEPSHYSSPGGGERYYKAEGKGIEKS